MRKTEFKVTVQGINCEEAARQLINLISDASRYPGIRHALGQHGNVVCSTTTALAGSNADGGEYSSDIAQEPARECANNG